MLSHVSYNLLGELKENNGAYKKGTGIMPVPFNTKTETSVRSTPDDRKFF